MTFLKHKKFVDRLMGSQKEYLDGIIHSYRIEPPNDDYICKLFIELSEKNDIETDEHYNVFKLEIELEIEHNGNRYYYMDEYENIYYISDYHDLSLLMFQFLLKHVSKLQTTLEKERHFHNAFVDSIEDNLNKGCNMGAENDR